MTGSFGKFRDMLVPETHVGSFPTMFDVAVGGAWSFCCADAGSDPTLKADVAKIMATQKRGI